MKKTLLTAIAAIAALSACTETYLESPELPISFQPAKYVTVTRASGDSVAFDTSKQFNCEAWFYPAVSSNDYASKQHFMNDQAIAYSNNEWAPTRTYYWPKNGKINFVSYYATTKPTIADNADGTAGTFEWSNIEVAGTEDFMYADEAFGYSKNVNQVMLSTTDPGFVGVPTVFHHAFCQVGFDVKANKLTDGKTPATTWEIKVNSAKLNGAFYKGSLSMTNTKTADETVSAWSLPSSTNKVGWTKTSDTQNVSMNSDVTLTTTAQTLLATRTFLPQALADQEFEITYTITTKYDGTAYCTETVTSKAKLIDFTTAVTEWGMNQKIIYHITLSPSEDKITFDPAVLDWDEVDGGTLAL